jgi:hypothetical protein
LANTTIEKRSYTSLLLLLLLFFDRKIEAATAGLPCEYSKFTKYQKIML